MIWAPRGWLKKADLLIIVGWILVAVGLLWVFYPGNMPKGFSVNEHLVKSSSSEIDEIYKNPTNAPQRLIIYSAQASGQTSHTTLRLVSVIFGLIFAACFYYLVRNWFGKTIGLMSTIIFCLSTFFILASKQASGEIMLFAPIAVMAAYMWLTRTDRKSLALILLLASVGIAIYIPGMVWFLAGGLILGWKKIAAAVEDVPTSYVALGFLALGALMIPLGMAIINDWRIVKFIALVPENVPDPITLLKNTAWMTSALFIKAPQGSVLILGGLPLLSLVQSALLVFGVYAMFSVAKKKLLSLTLAVIFAVLVAGLNNRLSLLFLGLPAIGILIAAGLRYLYIEWRGVFPHNPIPKSLALILMTMLVGIQLVYSLTYTLAAWPNAPATKTNYMIK